VLVLPLAIGLWWHALLFSVINGIMLWRRIRIEEQALGHSAFRL
jgi:isoprenylcysteine carboxyl methyltransferase (ICMT) family protein YpbQ